MESFRSQANRLMSQFWTPQRVIRSSERSDRRRRNSEYFSGTQIATTPSSGRGIREQINASETITISYSDTAMQDIFGTEKPIERVYDEKLMEIQKQLDKGRGLELDSKGMKIEHSTISSFITVFFETYTKLFDTIHLDDKSIQCRTRRRRSVGDMYLLAKRYVTEEEVTYEDVRRGMYGRYNLSATYCPDVHKMVFWQHNRGDGSTSKYLAKDEFGMFPNLDLLLSMKRSGVLFILPDSILAKIGE